MHVDAAHLRDGAVRALGGARGRRLVRDHEPQRGAAGAVAGEADALGYYKTLHSGGGESMEFAARDTRKRWWRFW